MEAAHALSLAAQAREAHHRQEEAEAEEVRQRTDARRQELQRAARAHLHTVLATVQLDDRLIVVRDVHADPFDQFGGWVRIDVDAIPVIYDYSGTAAAPQLALMVTCTTCGQETPGDSFDSLPSLGAALSRPGFIDRERHNCGCDSGRRTADLAATPTT